MSYRYHDDAVAFARSLIPTPFHHAARVPGVGIDCVGVVVLTGRHIGIWPEGFDVLPYPEVPRGMTMRTVCRQNLRRIRFEDMSHGDVILLITDTSPQHLGVIASTADGLSVIHASNAIERPRVLEQRLVFDRRFRFCEAYSFL